MSPLGAFSGHAALVIDGALVPSDGSDEMVVTDPADGSEAGRIPVADDATVDRAVAAATTAFRSWSRTTTHERAALLDAMAVWIDGHTDGLAGLLSREQGKPPGEARSEIGAAAKAFRFYAAEVVRAGGATIPTGSRTVRSQVMQQPSGVVAAITTWNYPVGLMAWKVAPALAAGCTVVAKPAEQAPLATLAMIEGGIEVGLPPGVLNAVSGPGASVGAALAGHPAVRVVTFTGGTATGKALLHLAADTVKRVILELGGHSPMVVAADAPLERAVADGVKRSFRNAGQLCNSVNRIYVDERIADAYLERFQTATAALTVGRPTADPSPDVGPMAGPDLLERVERHVADAVGGGARVLTGGARADDAGLAGGHYYRPTVLAGVTEEMLVSREETFGPVAPIAVVPDVETAIDRANTGEYGLVAYLYTTDLRTAVEGAERLEFGTVNVNNVGGGDVPFPYAGWKQSGLGVELGRAGLDAFTETKHVRTELGY